MKILFQGDSITDAGRDRSDCHNLGEGYPKYAARLIAEQNPQCDFEFINLGIGGNQTKDLVARLQEDFIDVNPDIVSIHIGVNDTWHHAADRSWIPNDAFEARYRRILQELKDKTKAKILIIEQYLLPVPDKAYFREDLDAKIDITRSLAREFADYYIPLDGLFAAACVGTYPLHWSPDGVHPNDNGSLFIAEHYARAIKCLLD